MLAATKSAWEILCDIPGCACSAAVVSDVLAKMQANGPDQGQMSMAVRRFAENNMGWFYEVMTNRRNERVLKRDVCPRHAPSYRTLLALRHVRLSAMENGTLNERKAS